MQGFTNKRPFLRLILKWMKTNADLKMVMEDMEVHKPPKIMELSKWTKWCWELFMTYLAWI